MMKVISHLGFLMCLLIAFNQECVRSSYSEAMSKKEKQEQMLQLEYQVLSRGYFFQVTIEGQKAMISSARGAAPQTVEINEEDHQVLKELIAALNVDKISELKSPTNKRQYDGAAHAQLSIWLNGKTYTSSGFDHGYPPSEIEGIVNKLVSLSPKN